MTPDRIGNHLPTDMDVCKVCGEYIFVQAAHGVGICASASTPSPREPSERRFPATASKRMAMFEANESASRAAPVSSSPPRNEKLSLMEVLRDWRSWWPTEYSDELTLSGKQANELCELLVDAPAGSQQGARPEVVALVDAFGNALIEEYDAEDVTLALVQARQAARSALLAAVAEIEQERDDYRQALHEVQNYPDQSDPTPAPDDRREEG